MLNSLLAVASAALLLLAFPKFNVAWLAPVALAPMLIALAREPRPLRRFLLGWVSGVVYWFGICYWIETVLQNYGGLGPAASWASFMLFCVTKALHMGFFALLAGILMRRWWAIPAVSALWVAVEVTHGSLGFAWLALGNAGINMAVPMRLAPFTGVYGLSFVFTMTATALALVVLRRPRLELAWLAVLPLLYAFPSMPAAQPGRETALLVQPNISETEDWTVDSIDQMQRNLVSTSLRGVLTAKGAPPSIVVWPEVPAPLYYFDDQHFQTYVNGLARAARAYLLIGTVARTPGGAPLNSAALISPDGRPISRYDKVNLVPFGEFVPWPFGFVNKISSEAGDFVAGTRVVVSPVGDHQIGAFICYESVFPNFVRKFVAGGAEVLFNISNDGYFGKSAAREQHLEIVRMRAAENRRWILRATNDGITATIDSAGRLRGTLPLYVEATSYTGFDYISQQTVYTRYGDWFPLLCAILTAGFLVVALVAKPAGIPK
ncbi:MAG TPA: apolipoprotein N-acyltransferase [Bryobacteraceae bacterium]|nr:apolipoprotein N-acyltransferase [Bryobacteraceae bacterium]